MALQFRTTTRNTWLDDLNTALGASAKLLIYSGPPPASVASTPTGLLLSSGARGNASGWGTVLAGVLTASAITADADAAASGTAGYFRWLDASNAVIFQGTITKVGAPGPAGDLVMSETVIAQHDTVAVSSWTLTAPGA